MALSKAQLQTKESVVCSLKGAVNSLLCGPVIKLIANSMVLIGCCNFNLSILT
jgi:hypothetical protein